MVQGDIPRRRPPGGQDRGGWFYRYLVEACPRLPANGECPRLVPSVGDAADTGAELRELVTLFNREGYVELGAAAQTALVAVSTLEDSVDNGCPEYLEEPLEVRL